MNVWLFCDGDMFCVLKFVSVLYCYSAHSLFLAQFVNVVHSFFFFFFADSVTN